MEQHASPVLTEQQHHSDTHLTLIRWPIDSKRQFIHVYTVVQRPVKLSAIHF